MKLSNEVLRVLKKVTVEIKVKLDERFPDCKFKIQSGSVDGGAWYGIKITCFDKSIVEEVGKLTRCFAMGYFHPKYFEYVMDEVYDVSNQVYFVEVR
jgi:hypothetical protein